MTYIMKENNKMTIHLKIYSVIFALTILTLHGISPSTVREAISHMTSYNEKVYMAGVKAVVFAKTQLPDGEVTIKFYYNWVSDRWVLNKVL